jgi:hypothetical protein
MDQDVQEREEVSFQPRSVNHDQDGHVDPLQRTFPSHVQAYDVLRRIGELEDAKQSISLEIQECMAQLEVIAAHIDEDSVLNRMLASVFPKVAKAKTTAKSEAKVETKAAAKSRKATPKRKTSKKR